MPGKKKKATKKPAKPAKTVDRLPEGSALSDDELDRVAGGANTQAARVVSNPGMIPGGWNMPGVPNIRGGGGSSSKT